MLTIVFLLISNIFMTFAWYGHLKYQNVPLWKVTLISWGIAFFEYSFQVPANRIGRDVACYVSTLAVLITAASSGLHRCFYFSLRIEKRQLGDFRRDFLTDSFNCDFHLQLGPR